MIIYNADGVILMCLKQWGVWNGVQEYKDVTRRVEFSHL